MNKTKVISIFIPHAGCPHDCIFCNQKKISGKVTPPSIPEVINIIENALNTINRDKYNVVLAYYGGSFTAIEYSLQQQYLRIAQNYKNKGLVDLIRISTRPDYLDENRIQLLHRYEVDHIEIGVQSTDHNVLYTCKRYYDLETIKNAIEVIEKYQIQYGFQIMLGLPEDDKIKIIKTCFDLLPFNPSTIRIYPTLVIKDTMLEDHYKKNQYKPLTLNKAIEFAVIPYIIFGQIQCTFLRIGLHPSESLLYDGNVITGPFHSAFGELVQSRLYWYRINDFLNDNSIKNKDLVIIAHPSQFSKIIGNKGENKKKLKDFFDIKIKLETAPIKNNDIIIKYEQNEVLLSESIYCQKKIDEYMDMLNRS